MQRIDQHLNHDWRSEFSSQFADSSVLVTGASGFVGDHLTHVLLELGAKITALGRTAWPSDRVTFVHADVRDRNAVTRAIDSVHPDLVFHLAGIVNTDPSIQLVAPTLEVNLLGSVNVMTALRQAGCGRLVIAGSSEEITHHQQRPSSPYAASKMAMADYSLLFSDLYGLPLVLARPFMSFGPCQQQHKVIPYVIIELLHGREAVIRSPERVCDLIYIADVVRGLLHAATDESAMGCIVDIGTGIGSPIGDVAETIADMIGTDTRPRLERGSEPLREPQIAFRSDGRRLRDWAPEWSLEEGLRETIEWYRVHTLSSANER